MSDQPTTLDDIARRLAADPISVRGDAAAKLIDISLRHFRARRRRAHPRGMRLGRCKIWSVDELRDWLAAGSPARDTWEQMKGGV